MGLDWDGDGDHDFSDGMMDFMIFNEVSKGTGNRNNTGGGCCLFSFLLIVAPFAGAIVLIGSLIG